MDIELDKLQLLVMKYKELYGRELIGENIMDCIHNDFNELSNAYATHHISLGKKMYYDKLKNDNGETAEHFRLKDIPQDTVLKKAKALFGSNVEKLYLYLYERNKCNEDNYLTFNLLDGRVSMKYERNSKVNYISKFERTVRATCLRFDKDDE